MNVNLRKHALELLNEKSVFYTKNDITCSVTFRTSGYHVLENNRTDTILNRVVHEYFREYFIKNNLDLKISINVWSCMRDENNRTIDEMLNDISDSNELKKELNESPKTERKLIRTTYNSTRLVDVTGYNEKQINYVHCLVKTDDDYSYCIPSRKDYFTAEEILKIEERFGKAKTYMSNETKIHTLQYIKHFKCNELHEIVEAMKEKMIKRGTYYKKSKKSAPNTMMPGQSRADYSRANRDNMLYTRKHNIF